MNLNQVNIIGRITRDIELKALPSGVKVGTFSIATNRVWFDQDKVKQEDVEFHNILAWGKQAETLATYAHKGDLIYIGGRLQTRNWEDKETQKKMYRTEIVVEAFQFAPKGTNQGGSSSGSGYADKGSSKPTTKKTTTKKNNEAVDNIEYPEEEVNPEDIPF
jgi:single-strand DNA-binding protein